MAETGPVVVPEAVVPTAEPVPESEAGPVVQTVNIEDRNHQFIHETISNERDKVGARLQLNESRLKDLPEVTGEPTDPKKVEIEGLLKEDRREYSKLTLDLWRKGGKERIEPNDLTILQRDLIDLAERSALAELVLSRHGHKTAQDALRKLKLSEIQVDDLSVALEDKPGLQKFWRSTIVQEQVKKLGISGGLSVTTAIVVAVAGGPVSWATLGLGLAGGAAGRGLGELVRGKMLRRQVEKPGDGDEKERFNEKAGRDLFELIVSLQAEGKAIQEAKETDDPNANAQKMLKLIEKANQVESRSHKDVKKMERIAAWVKGGLSVVGAVGGSLLGSALLHPGVAAKIEAAQAGKDLDISKAVEHGVRIEHVKDAAGQVHAQLTLDPSQGHLVKQTADEAWRYVIEQKDILDWDKAAIARGDWIKEFYHSYLSSAPDGVGPVVPHALPSSELLHAGTVDENIISLVSAKYDAVMAAARGSELWANWWGAGLAVGFTAATEAGYAISDKAKRAEIERDDRALIKSMGEVEEMLRAKIILPADGRAPNGWLFPEDPKRFEQFFKDLADYYHVPLPKNPREYSYDWNTQPSILDKKTIDGKVDFWYHVQRGDELDHNNMPVEAQSVQQGGTEIVQYGVLGISPEKNRIAIVGKDTNPDTQEVIYPVKIVRLDQFLAQYRLNGPLKEKPAA